MGKGLSNAFEMSKVQRKVASILAHTFFRIGTAYVEDRRQGQKPSLLHPAALSYPV